MSQNATTGSSEDKTSIIYSPYLLGTLAVTVITLLAVLLSVLVVCRRLHLFRYCSLFLVELAVGSLTTEAIVHLLPNLIKTPGAVRKKGMPPYFPRLATVTAGVCLLHVLDTASVVFFGRRQSTSHALEWREAGHHVHHRTGHNEGATGAAGSVGASSSEQQQQQQDSRSQAAASSVSSMDSQLLQMKKQQQMRHLRVSLISNQTATDFGEELTDIHSDDGDPNDGEDDDIDDACSSPDQHLTDPGIQQVGGGSSPEPPPSEGGGQVDFEDSSGARDADGDITLRQALRRPRLCLQPGPYRLCSILSAGSILHSFADGVAIGAAFAKGWDSGLHLSVSVGMHELAHKMADFAVLTASGFTLQAVMLLNVCYLVSALIGLFIAVPLSLKSEVLQAWIMTVATAVFVYISLVTMSSMVRRNYVPRHITAFFVGNLGMTSGFILIMLASLLEFYT